jgi:putative ABC transport system ATP-binding protein
MMTSICQFERTSALAEDLCVPFADFLIIPQAGSSLVPTQNEAYVPLSFGNMDLEENHRYGPCSITDGGPRPPPTSGSGATGVFGRPMFSLKNVSKVYKTGDIETTALNDVTLDISSGEFVSIMGPSGCGKSTLLNIIGLLDSPTGGDYFVFEDNVARSSEAELSRIRKDTVGFIFQSFNLIQELSIAENVDMALLYHNLPAAERKVRVKEALERMQIAHRAEHRPAQLSGGQQQRVAIARALVSKPKLLLADEPTGNLDSLHGEDVMHLLTELNKEGATIVMVTHSLTHANYANRIVNLFDGQIVAENFLETKAM